MIGTLVEKIKRALRNETCSHCQFHPVSGELVCTDCRSKLGFREPLPLLRKGSFQLYAATLLNPRIKRLLYPYKFYHRHDYAECLSDILIDYWQRVPKPGISARNTLVVPVPGRWRNNHIAPFARRFASEFGYGFNERLLTWGRDTVPQHQITSKRRRWENVREGMSIDAEVWESLAARKNPDSQPAGPAQILIVDDMTTTGATLYEASQALERFPAFDGRTVTLALCHVPLALQRQLS